MNTSLLGILVVFVAFSQIGCGKSKKQKLEQQIQGQIQAMNACMSSIECQQRARMAAQDPASQQHIANALANGGSGVVQKNANGQYMPVLPASLKEQAAKVQAALAADSNNPRSLYYDPPQAARAPASATATPASATTAATTAMTPSSVGNAFVGGDGEIMR